MKGTVHIANTIKPTISPSHTIIIAHSLQLSPQPYTHIQPTIIKHDTKYNIEEKTERKEKITHKK